MTMVKGGVAYNVIPAEMDVSFDLRIPPTVNLQVCKPACFQLCECLFACVICSCSHADVSSTGRYVCVCVCVCEMTSSSMLTLRCLLNYQPTRSLKDRSKSGVKKQEKMSLMNLLRSAHIHSVLDASCSCCQSN